VRVLACLVPGSVREICGCLYFSFSLSFFFWKIFLFFIKKQFNNHMYMLMKLMCTSQRGNMWHVRLSLSAKSVSHSAVFFSHSKSANSTFSHSLLAKRTGRQVVTAGGGVREGGHLAAISRLVSLTLRGQEADTVVVAPLALSSIL
jgi:hypothetical protein